MTEQEIIEGNKLIAEFMDYEHDDNDEDSVTYCCDHLVNISEVAHWESSIDDWTSWLRADEMKFHSSWDWLMPVFKKIWESIDQFQYDDEPYLYITEEIFHPDYLLSDFINNNIEGVWNRCVEFIKWYNKSKEVPMK
jgi:hypothetical protein